MYSMTGFIHKEYPLLYHSREYILTIQLKRVNSRFCDIALKTSSLLHSMEHKYIQIIKQELKRGSIQGYIFLEPLVNKKEDSLLYDKDFLEYYHKDLLDISKRYSLPYHLSDLIKILHENKKNINIKPLDEKEYKIFEEYLLESINKLKKQSFKEGSETKKNILESLDNIYSAIDKLKNSKIDTNIFKKKEIFEKKITNLFLNSTIIKESYQEIFNVELFRMLEKLDVNEEMQRTECHLINLKKTINDLEYEKAKKIEFILQELFREINTLSVKLQNIELNEITLQIKLEIEKIREQIQNIH